MAVGQGLSSPSHGPQRWISHPGHGPGALPPASVASWPLERGACSKPGLPHRRLPRRVPFFGWGAQFFGNSDLCRRRRPRGPSATALAPAITQPHPPTITPWVPAASLPLPIVGANGEIAWAEGAAPAPQASPPAPAAASLPGKALAAPAGVFGKHTCWEAAASSAQNRRKVSKRSPEDSPKIENPAGV